jgi:hypothetical protein
MAGELTLGDSLMPLYRKQERQRAKAEPYGQVYQPWYNFWEWTHHMVAREFSGVPLMKGNVVHHKDERTLNNEPLNLEQLSREAHCSLHGELNGSKHTEAYEKYLAGRSLRSLAQEYGFSHTGIREKFAEAEFKSKKELASEALNHSVIAVESAGCADVYDLEVNRSHNFGLTCGIFVHNSHAKNALARFNQAEGIPVSEKSKVHGKVVAAAKKFGVHVSEESDKIAAILDTMRKTARAYVNKNFEKIVSPRILSLDTDLGKLKKGMYEVSCLAVAIENLARLTYCVSCEQEWEGDTESIQPEMLADCVKSLTETLIEMVDEETRELVDQLTVAAKTR